MLLSMVFAAAGAKIERHPVGGADAAAQRGHQSVTMIIMKSWIMNLWVDELNRLRFKDTLSNSTPIFSSGEPGQVQGGCGVPCIWKAGGQQVRLSSNSIS